MDQTFPAAVCRATVAWALLGLSLAGCVTRLDSMLPVKDERVTVLLVGRALTVLTGERARKYEPTVRSMEFIELGDGTRYQIDIGGNDTVFAVHIPAGRYNLNRVQINEGPFLSIAQPEVSIGLEEGPVIFAGTWRFGVDSPKYGRTVLLSALMDEESRALFQDKVRAEFPSFASSRVMTVLPVPTEVQARLYEVAPYPRVPRYFRRHNW